MTYITTFSGKQVDLLRPTAEMISSVDIAHHLANTGRWAGATRSFYSVAQHSVLLTYIVPPELAQWALMHDAAEAYIGDITRPLKSLLRPTIQRIEVGLMSAICTAFGLTFPEPERLSVYDDQMIRFEAETMLPQHSGEFVKRGGGFTHIDPLQPWQHRRLPIHAMTMLEPMKAKVLFAMRFGELFPSFDSIL